VWILAAGVVIAATNRPNAVDPALRRPGRFDREIYISPPAADARLDILRVLTEKLTLSENAQEELQRMAQSCAGYVGADFGAVCREAALLALEEQDQQQQRKGDDDSGFDGDGGGDGDCAAASHRLGVIGGSSRSAPPAPPVVRSSHLQAALRSVRPASQRSMWSTEVPHTKWSDIGGLAAVKNRLQRYIEWPFRYPGKRSFSQVSYNPHSATTSVHRTCCMLTDPSHASQGCSRCLVFPPYAVYCCTGHPAAVRQR
jgi:transitional endoplasmic reticulum ATPase